MPSLEMLKQLLDEFAEKEAHTAEEINVITQRIDELEMRVETSKQKLVSIASDREKLYAMKSRYADPNWGTTNISDQFDASEVPGNIPATPPPDKPGARVPAQNKSKAAQSQASSSKAKASVPLPEPTPAKTGRSSNPFITTPQKSQQPSNNPFTSQVPNQFASQSLGVGQEPGANYQYGIEYDASKRQEPAQSTRSQAPTPSLFEPPMQPQPQAPSLFEMPVQPSAPSLFESPVQPQAPSPAPAFDQAPEPPPVVAGPAFVHEGNPFFRSMSVRSRPQMPPATELPPPPPMETPVAPDPQPAPAQQSNPTSPAIADLGEEDEGDDTVKSINAALRGLFR